MCTSYKQTRKSPIPVPPIPDLAGNRGLPPGIGGGESPIPDSAGIGKQRIPVSRFGRDRESGSRWRRAGDFLVWLLKVLVTSLVTSTCAEIRLVSTEATEAASRLAVVPHTAAYPGVPFGNRDARSLQVLRLFFSRASQPEPPAASSGLCTKSGVL